MATAITPPKSPRELFRIAKKHGMWDPEQIPIAEDRGDWERLTHDQREQLLRVCALFYEGEVSVADTLAWWLAAMPDQERRIFLAVQIFEEVKHAEFFALYFREVFGGVDTAAYLVPAYRGVLVDELRERGKAIGRAVLSGDAEELDRALVLGMAHYMGIIEGSLAVTGYDFFDEMLTPRGLLPRLLEGIRLIRIDEGRHIAHGMDYLREKLAARSDYREQVAQLFWQEAQNTARRADFIFELNAFEMDRERMVAISMEHMRQRIREMGLTAAV